MNFSDLTKIFVGIAPSLFAVFFTIGVFVFVTIVWGIVNCENPEELKKIKIGFYDICYFIFLMYILDIFIFPFFSSEWVTTKALFTEWPTVVAEYNTLVVFLTEWPTTKALFTEWPTIVAIRGIEYIYLKLIIFTLSLIMCIRVTILDEIKE